MFELTWCSKVTDIMFATDFEIANDMYQKVTGKESKINTHRGFWNNGQMSKLQRQRMEKIQCWTFIGMSVS